MKISQIETLTPGKGIEVHAGAIQWLWVRIHTDEGLCGIGETYPAASASEAVILDTLGPMLLGRDPLQIEKLWAEMFLKVSYHGWAGAEIRAISAIDLALWDLFGKYTEMPVWQLLGGKCRDWIPTYNTCYEPDCDVNREAGRLAKDLLQQNIKAMKIWPFDSIALENGGQRITKAQLERGLAPVRQIREAVGSQMAIAMEFHGYWNLPCAIQIAKALEPYDVLWLEEMLPQDNMSAYRQLAGETSIPLVLSERLMTRWQFREVIEGGFAQYVNPDICWCGGLTEARKIAAHADTHYLPVAPHNCGGPVLHFASMHLAAHVPNLFLLESVRRHYMRDYQGLVRDTGKPSDGRFPVPQGPGLGVELDNAVLRRPDLVIKRVQA